MKKLIFSIAMLFLAIGTFAQGLDSIYVEKYYVTNANDSIGAANAGTGVLPVGSVTWRLYADLAPGYTLQAVYGVNAPVHNLVFTTTTGFYNNEDNGGQTPTGLNLTNLRKHTALIDTWFAFGSNGSLKAAVVKSEDSDGSVGNTNVPPLLQNADPSALPAISAVDGMIPAASAPSIIFPGWTAAQLAVIDNISNAGNSIIINNASVAVLGGVTGPTATNRILIGQFTTNGIFHYELNLQIGTPSNGVLNYVASNPVSGELTQASLTGTLNVPNTPPTTSITAPANNASYVFPANITPVTAIANDPDGSITQVELLVDGNSVQTITGNAGTYNFNALTNLSVGSHVLRSRATDNGLSVTTSGPINITIGNNLPPTISITSPANGTPFVAPAVVNITTNANDPDGTVAQVEFLVDNVVVGTVLAPGPFNFGWVSGAPFGTRQLKARVTDNNNAVVTSAPVNITVSDPNALAYGVVSASNTCVPATFCLSVEARDSVDNVIGYDVVMHFDPVKVIPTGVVTVDNDLVNPAFVDVINSVDNANGLIYISLFFNGNAPAGYEFHGIGNIFCAEFAKTGNFANVDNTSIQINSLQESYITGVASVPADPGTYSTFRDTSFGGKLRFWFNNGPINYNSAIPSQHLITNIYGTDAACGNQSVIAVQPDLNGDFIYDINNGEKISIKKDIAAATSVQPVVNGFDAFLTRRVLINDLAFLPNVYQMIAMDVNMDGVVSAGDLSQINQRTVLILPEYKQAWNYDNAGNPIPPVRASKDWEFIDNATVNTNLNYLISTTYPFDDGIGYSKSRVPQVPFCLSLPSSSADSSGDCAILVTETYKGILLGDVNGNFATVVPNSAFRADGYNKVVFDVDHAVKGNGYVDVPVSVQFIGEVNALDFAMQSRVAVNSVIDHTGNLQSLANFNSNDNTFRFTSYSLQTIETGSPVVSVRFNTNAQIIAADLSSVEAYVNGERVGADLGINSDNMVTLFPNPATDMINVVVAADANVQLLDATGSEVASTLVYANQKREINTATLASGVYMLKVSNNNFVSVKKVVIQK